MKKATLVYPLREGEVLLGMKKIGFGAGKWNGFGGKVEESESVAEAAARELNEECGLIASAASLEPVARIEFFFAEQPVFECHVFFARAFSGKPQESDEMQPQWWQLTELPWEHMWSSDPYWLPQVFGGERLSAVCRFDAAGEKVERFSVTVPQRELSTTT